MTGPFTRLIRRFRRDQSGVSALEFALLAPVMILFYFGLAELTQGIIADRRTLTTASSIGDLIAQANGTTTPAEIDDTMNLAKLVMYPFPVNDSVLSICVAQITASSDAIPIYTVKWRRLQNKDDDCPALNETVTDLKAGLIGANESVIMSRVTYKYTSSAGIVLKTTPTLVKTYYLRPRRTTSIDCSDGTTNKGDPKPCS